MGPAAPDEYDEHNGHGEHDGRRGYGEPSGRGAHGAADDESAKTARAPVVGPDPGEQRVHLCVGGVVASHRDTCAAAFGNAGRRVLDRPVPVRRWIDSTHFKLDR